MIVHWLLLVIKGTDITDSGPSFYLARSPIYFSGGSTKPTLHTNSCEMRIQRGFTFE